jgi:hypothetical protein
VFEDGGGKEAAPGETNAEGAEFGQVGGVFVEGGEIVASEGVTVHREKIVFPFTVDQEGFKRYMFAPSQGTKALKKLRNDPVR